MKRPYRDRTEAGKAVARRLGERRDLDDPVVLALPRGGLPVAYEVARALGAPLDVLVVRKLGIPRQPELAMGAIASGGGRVIDLSVMRQGGASEDDLRRVLHEETREMERREALYRGRRPSVPVKGRTVILVDDGLATGSSMLAAVRALKARQPARIVVAVPLAAAESCARLAEEADAVVCPLTPEPFVAVGLWYDSFPQVSDDEVREILARAGGELQGGPQVDGRPGDV